MVKVAEETTNKRELLDKLIAKIDTSFGKGSIMRLGDNADMTIARTSTGALTLDLALGGGLPKGRIIELYGPYSSGKTTVALHALAEVQKTGQMVAFVDAEHALDPIYAAALGVNVEEMLVSQPSNGEEALEVCIQLIESKIIGMVVVDSVAALVPRAELEGEIGDAHVALQARMMSQACRKMTGIMAKSDCTVIFLNQLRDKVGISYGSPETQPGGKALQFYASVRLDIRRIQTLKKGTEEYGIRAKVKVAKNKVAPPFRIGEFDILFGQGISTMGCLVDLAEHHGVIVRKGGWYSYEGNNVGHGRDNTIQWLKDNPDKAAEVETMVRSFSAPESDAPVVVEEEEA